MREAEQVIDGSKTDFPGGRGRLAEMLSQAKITDEAEINALYQAHSWLRQIEELVLEKLGHEWRPEFNQALQLFDVIMNVVGNPQPASTEASSAPEESSSAQHAGESSHQASQLSKVEAIKEVSWKELSISTRADAILALEKVCSYFEVHEPSHPAPFLIRRVQQTIPLNFYDMIKNLVPGSHEQFDIWLAKTEDNDE